MDAYSIAQDDHPEASMHRQILSAAVLILLAGCGGGGDGGGNPPDPDPTVAKATPSGDAQTGTVDQELPDPLRVRVTLDGTPEAGHTVNWTAFAGSVAPTSSVTDADGIASTTWTLGTAAGAQSARATLTGATGSPVTFAATGTADVAAALVKVSGDGQGGRTTTAAGSPIVVRTNDQFGNPVAGTAVTFAVTAGSATLGSLNDDTGADGRAQTTVTFGATPGSITITATAAGLTGSPQTFTAESGQILVENDVFQPGALVIAAGTTVRWVWATNAVSHSVVAVGGAEPAASPVRNAPFVHQHTFNTPGVYNYQCSVHGNLMTGTITVQ
jgi:adhesin/invasin